MLSIENGYIQKYLPKNTKKQMSFFIVSVFGFILSKVTYAKDVTVQPHILFVVADDLGLSSFSDMILQVVKTVSRTSS